MSEHPIEGLMVTAMESIKDMVDVNTIIGEPIETTNNIIIIPISKVNFGFASGGSEFNTETLDGYSKKEKEEEIIYKLPFGGGSGAAVSISPIAFLIVQDSNVKLLPIEHASTIDKLLDYMPDIVDKIGCFLNKSLDLLKEENEKENKIIENIENKEKKEKQKTQQKIEENQKVNIKTVEVEYDETQNEKDVGKNFEEEYEFYDD